MSMFSTISASVAPGFAAASSKRYRFTTTKPIGLIPCFAIAAMCAGLSRIASSPPCTAGCSVFTRPSSISGNPVTSEISATFKPLPAISLAVPPVEMSSMPSPASPRAKSARPVLSVTLKRAQSIFFMYWSCPFGLQTDLAILHFDGVFHILAALIALQLLRLLFDEALEAVYVYGIGVLANLPLSGKERLKELPDLFMILIGIGPLHLERLRSRTPAR